MKKYVTGLVVGKFCPLHKGHEYLIDTALEQCERVVVLSYTSTDFGPKFSAKKRDIWFKNVYGWVGNKLDVHVIDSNSRAVPEDDAHELVHRDFCANYLLEIGTSVQAVFTSESYGEGFAQKLQEFFQHKLKTDITVDHVMVDYHRLAYPVSGTALRTAFDVEQVPLGVAQTFIPKVLFLGGESTGKTTLTKQMSKEYGYSYVPEYGRELYEYRNGKLMYEDMLSIAQTQIKYENNVSRCCPKYLFCDTSPLTTLFYSMQMFGRADSKLKKLAYDSLQEYDYVFLCMPDFPFVQDGTRRDEEFRQLGTKSYINSLMFENKKYVSLYGDLETRVAIVKSVLENAK
jgi:NadR type nicotinamide-nucleotide adenylyltransferase